MKIARVFPTKTRSTPEDGDTYFDLPGLFTPKYDEVHISVTFTWDIPKAKILGLEWAKYGKVMIGGPALDNKGGEFTPGMYLKPGITITSRGCPKNCSFCFVPKREGKIRELTIKPGNIIQDNNLLACSRSHIDRVFTMLKSQRAIDFNGGLDAYYLTDVIVEKLRGLKIYQMWLAFDSLGNEKALRLAVNRLSKYFKRDKIRCYVLVGYQNDTIEKAEERLIKAWDIGTLPFAMLYRPREYSREWKQFQRLWARPAIMKSMMKGRGL